VSSKSRNRRRKTSVQAPAARQQQVREQKHAQFAQPRSRTKLHLIAAVAALAVVAVLAFYFTAGRNGGGSVAQATTASVGGDVSIPLAKISDGKAHFYSYETGGVKVKYFVMKSSDGVYRAALDACEVCYPQKKGYHQEGDQMVCNNCGRRFDSVKINVITGGCNPIPLQKTKAGGDLQIAASSLQAGVKYFQ
jgi:uncharacterized membrane protein